MTAMQYSHRVPYCVYEGSVLNTVLLDFMRHAYWAALHRSAEVAMSLRGLSGAGSAAPFEAWPPATQYLVLKSIIERSSTKAGAEVMLMQWLGRSDVAVTWPDESGYRSSAELQAQLVREMTSLLLTKYGRTVTVQIGSHTY